VPTHTEGWLLDSRVMYLNHGSFGACPRHVMEYRGRLLCEIEAEPMDFLVRRLPEETTTQITALESFLGAQPGTIVLTDNTTTGINSVFRSISFRPGETVLLSNQAYFSTRNALKQAASRAGAVVKTIPFTIPVSGPGEVLEQLMNSVDPTVRYAVLDHISSPTGMVFPLARAVSSLREAGVEVIADGAHGPGHMPLSLSELGCAWYVGNCHKWLCSPRSCAILYTRPDMKGITAPAITSHVPGDFQPGPDPLRVMFDWSGTPDPSPRLCVKESIDYMATLHPGGWSGIMQRNASLALKARSLLLDATRTEPPFPGSMVGCMASVKLPDLDNGGPRPIDWFDPIQQALRERGIEAPVIQCLPGRFLRVSAQLYNDLSQYEHLAGILRGLL
jgi:isopenicillin-N epimerase